MKGVFEKLIVPVIEIDFSVFQLTLQACDNGIPRRCISRPLTINVIRDSLPPTFVPQAAFVFVMNETEVPRYTVGRVTAFDSNPLVSPVCLASLATTASEISRMENQPPFTFMWVLLNKLVLILQIATKVCWAIYFPVIFTECH